MEQSLQEFYNQFRNSLHLDADATGAFQLECFMDIIARELEQDGIIENFTFCSYTSQRGMRVDGYCFNEDGCLSLFIGDYDDRLEPETLGKSDVDAFFRRGLNFLSNCTLKPFYSLLEETSPEYSLARLLWEERNIINRVKLFLFSDRVASTRLKAVEADEAAGFPIEYYIWDLSRLFRQQQSREHKEILEIDFKEQFKTGLKCLPAYSDSTCKSFLAVIPGEILAQLYGIHGSALLEQNVRCFLQARGKVNQGIRNTIINNAHMFFAYNNGICVTAQDIKIESINGNEAITYIKDFQIVNGGQTTASLFFTNWKDKASLDEISVQMKLTIVNNENDELIVSKISEYANTQNRVNAADFFSNHPFHIRIQEFSRRILAPTQGGIKDTKWFYERTRGQYQDSQAKMTSGEKNRFKAEYPSHQVFTKTDLAKYENVWEDHPKWVNLGAQKNFARFAEQIGKQWDKDKNAFNEFYYKRLIGRAILFKYSEKMVQKQTWYHGGYRANIVAYTLSILAEICNRKNSSLDYLEIWRIQNATPELQECLPILAQFANEAITSPPSGLSNLSEWAKKEGCWQQILNSFNVVINTLPATFLASLISKDKMKEESVDAKKIQKEDNGIIAQKRVWDIPSSTWKDILNKGRSQNLFTSRDCQFLEVACNKENKLPSEKQSVVICEILNRAQEAGIADNNL